MTNNDWFSKLSTGPSSMAGKPATFVADEARRSQLSGGTDTDPPFVDDSDDDSPGKTRKS